MSMRGDQLNWARLSAITRNTMQSVSICTDEFKIGKNKSNDLHFTGARIADYHCVIKRVFDQASGK